MILKIDNYQRKEIHLEVEVLRAVKVFVADQVPQGLQILLRNIRKGMLFQRLMAFVKNLMVNSGVDCALRKDVQKSHSAEDIVHGICRQKCLGMLLLSRV